MDASTVTFKANNPSYSYCKINETNTNLVEYMVEKEIISQTANVGIYSFRSVNKFIEYANEILLSNTRVKNEFYISSVFDSYIKDDKKDSIITGDRCPYYWYTFRTFIFYKVCLAYNESKKYWFCF